MERATLAPTHSDLATGTGPEVSVLNRMLRLKTGSRSTQLRVVTLNASSFLRQSGV